jgi:putative transposase
MPRKLRVEYPGAIYHVMSRTDGKGEMFLTGVDRQDFLKTLAEACVKTGFQSTIRASSPHAAISC